MTFEEWCLDILQQELGTDWQVKPGEPYCWIEQKVITFRFDENAGDYAGWLHEIAHGLHPEMESFCACRQPNHYHGGGWFSKFHYLVQKYMRPLGTVS
jgi:hypothetical protein